MFFHDLSPAWLNRLPEPLRRWLGRNVPSLRRPVVVRWGDPVPRSRYLTRNAEALIEDGFAQALMVAFHPEEIEPTVRAEERALTRLISAVPCPGPHADALVSWTFGPRAGTSEYKDDVLDGRPCSSCGAAV